MTDYDPVDVDESPNSRTRDIFDKMDVNHDGVLSKDEFVRGCLNDERLYSLLACSSGTNGGSGGAGGAPEASNISTTADPTSTTTAGAFAGDSITA